LSARKNNLRKYPIVTNGDMTTTITSAVTNIQFLDNIAIQLNFTGTPTGTFQVQVSVDYAQDDQGNVQVAGNWIPVLLPQSPVASGSAGFILIDLNQLASPWIRLVYVPSGGSGTLNAFISAKEL